MECKDNQILTTPDLINSGPILSSDQRCSVTTLDTYNILDSLRYFTNGKSSSRFPKDTGFDADVTLHIRSDVKLKMLAVSLENGPFLQHTAPSITQLIYEIKTAYHENTKKIDLGRMSLYELEGVRAIVYDSEYSLYGLTRYGVDLLSKAEDEVIVIQNKMITTFCKTGLILKQCSTIGANGLVEMSYVNALHNIDLDEQPDQLLADASRTTPAAFGIENEISKVQKIVPSQTYTVAQGGTMSFKRMSGLYRKHNEISRDLLTFLNGGLALLPMQNLIGTYLAEQDLNNVDQNKSLIEQNWVVSFEGSKRDVHLENYAKIAINNHHIIERHGLSEVQNLSHKHLTDIIMKNFHYQITVTDFQHLEPSLLRNIIVQNIHGRQLKLSEIVGPMSFIKGLWKGLVSVFNKSKPILDVAIKSAYPVISAMNQKHHFIPDHIIDFIDNGPDVFANVNSKHDWCQNSKQVINNVLPYVLHHMNGVELNPFPVQKMVERTEQFMDDELKQMSQKKESTVSKTSRVKIIRKRRTEAMLKRAKFTRIPNNLY